MLQKILTFFQKETVLTISDIFFRIIIARGTKVINATSFVIIIEKKKHNKTSNTMIDLMLLALDNIFSAR